MAKKAEPSMERKTASLRTYFRFPSISCSSIERYIPRISKSKRVFNEQVKLYNYTEQALKETYRIYRDKKILSKYIIQREAEIMNIMTALFDQDYVTGCMVTHFGPHDT